MQAIAATKSFQTAAQLIAELEKFALGSGMRLDEIYVQDCDRVELDRLELIQESLSDGSVVFNVILSAEGDPNS